MRNDHPFFARLDTDLPSQEDIDRSIARARRMRSVAVHAYLARIGAWARAALRPARAPEGPVGQCC